METGPACPVSGCGAVTTGGDPPMQCRGYGSTDPLCMANWLTIDPEDAGTYAQYLMHERGECGPGCPYTVVHESNLHRAGECDPATCVFRHPSPSG